MSKGFMCRQLKLSQSAYLPEVDRSLKLKLKMSDLVSSPEIPATEDKVNMTVYTNNNNNNKLYLHDYNKVLQYCKSYLKLLIDSL